MTKNPADMTKGIVIIASGHPQYGRMAYNLAVSIKAAENFPVACIYSGPAITHLSEAQRKVFDYLIPAELPQTCCAKVYAYENSPFDCTLLLDADMIWLPIHNPSELFADLDGVEFTAISEGDTDNPAGHYFFWADIEEIKNKFDVEKVNQYRTEVMYFIKSEKIEAFFNKAKELITGHGLSKVKKFAGGVADELVINIAAAIYGLEPHDKNWRPSYWPRLHGDVIPDPSDLYRKYYLLSVGGNHAPSGTQKFYNGLMKAQSRKIGHQHLFALQSKYSYLPEREKG